VRTNTNIPHLLHYITYEENSLNGNEVAFDPAIVWTMSQVLLAKLQYIIATSSQDEFLSLQNSSMSALKVEFECSSGIIPASNWNSSINDSLYLQPGLGMLKLFLNAIFPPLLHDVLIFLIMTPSVSALDSRAYGG
jgi:hypothetical protein